MANYYVSPLSNSENARNNTMKRKYWSGKTTILLYSYISHDFTLVIVYYDVWVSGSVRFARYEL